MSQFPIGDHSIKCHKALLTTFYLEIFGSSADALYYSLGTLVIPTNEGFNATSFQNSYGYFGVALTVFWAMMSKVGLIMKTKIKVFLCMF